MVAEDTSNLVKREACLVANPDNPDVCNNPDDESAVAREDGASPGGKAGPGVKLSRATALMASAAAAAFQKESNNSSGNPSADDERDKPAAPDASAAASAEAAESDGKTPWNSIRP